jgi:thymidylate synthase
MLVSAWNPSVLPDTTKSFDENVANNKAALPPCHAFSFMFRWTVNYHINCTSEVLTFFLRCSFNIASYALLTMMIAQVCDLEPGNSFTLLAAHIYNNHFEQLNCNCPEPKPLPK